ncbi:antibiotic biosynthesis monooxygenase [Chroococcidiopsis sp. FACHB-1243]|uniref:antibiotic biosynthesis monooxygenase family protein n=1 Tax=Chroococcidiopsis sp. [FACHB-1243] TaxID=2692781 RepID=UPI00177BF03F|nr:antibiotic biosynthesis monooxygenase [Chroococcidiopsis sp. [FACHB-1243]]MBD2307888.1 antibiotic biosynthesis monooxygenase [Chroococcidiopsis sp. [FACHB-1243]]
MIQIDSTNAVTVGLDLYSVAPRHQDGLVEAIVQQQIESWLSSNFLKSASVHKSLDSVRVFTYSQWMPKFDYRNLSRPTIFTEFFPPDSHLLEVFASRSLSQEVSIVAGDRITHLAEFRMISANQQEMVKRASSELDRAMNNSPGLISATFHRSLDGTRVFNYGQWESQEAFEAILKQPGFNPDEPYWAGIARNEFHLYQIVHAYEK